MMRPRLPPASWLLLLAAAATQCPDTDETLDLRVVLSDAQGFRRNDVRWSLSAAASMDAYAAGALVGGGNATLDAGAELALPTLCAEPGNYWLAFQRLPDECVADIELLACATPTPAPTAVPSVGAHSPPDDVQDAHDSRAILGAHDRERVARAVHPAEPAADAPAVLQAHGGAHSAADEPRAIVGAVAHADGATHSDADARPDARADAGARAGADAAADA